MHLAREQPGVLDRANRTCGRSLEGVLMRRHGHNLNNRRRTPTYNSWRAMVERCTYSRHPFYPDYGGRGITVCDRWRRSFAAFLSDMGVRPTGHTLDRIDVDGDYGPGNCRWSTVKQQR